MRISRIEEIKTKRVLVVDNSITNRRLLKEWLESWQIPVVTAADAKEAMQVLTRDVPAAPPISIVLIDAELPGSEGFRLARWIADGAPEPLRTIMMAPPASQESRVQREGLWIQATLAKPVRRSALLDVLIQAAASIQAEGGDPAAAVRKATAGSRSCLNILVVEDTPFNQKLILRLLSRWGHQATVVENGRLAVEALEKDLFDLVLMDVQMPEMDGFEATTRIRHAERRHKRHIPIIAMTAHDMKEDRERCLAAGMDDYISKPISTGALQKSIASLLPPESNISGPLAHAARVHRYSSSPPFDTAALLAAFDNDLHFLKETVDMFVSDFPAMLTDIYRAIRSNDADALRRAAHALKGMVGNFQAQQAADVAYILEENGRQNSFENVDRTFELLKDEMSCLEKCLLAITGKGLN